MGCLDHDPFMRRLAEVAIARREELTSGARLHDDPYWRDFLRWIFGPAHAATVQSVPRARGILEEPAQPRGVIAAMKGR